MRQQNNAVLNQPIDVSAGRSRVAETIGQSVPWSSLTTGLLLTLLCFCAYHATFYGYFVADDLPAVADWYQIWSNNGPTLFQKMISPWQAVSNQAFYRPLPDLTLGLDYLVWKTNAFGYHLTNVLLHVGCTLLLWLLSRKIFVPLFSGKTESWLIPALAATLFAVHPIHMEPVAWIIGRVDTVCTLFCLLSLLCFTGFLQEGHRKYLLGALISFVAALLSKENAVLLPVVFAGFCLGYKRNLRCLLPFAIAIVFYLGLRFAVLGTLVGGYSGSLGEVSAQAFLARTFNTGTLKLFYPFNEYVKHDLSLVLFYLGSVITGVSLILLARREAPPSKAIAILVLSIVVAAVITLPALSAFYLNGTLGGGRFFYLPSAAVCIGFASLFSWLMLSRITWIRHTARVGVGIWICSLLLFCIEDGQSWVEAGHRTKAFRTAVQAKLTQHPDAVITVVSKLKQNKNEALFYNQSMQDALFKPPFFPSDESGRVASFSWTHHIAEDPFNYSVFQNYVRDGRHRFFLNEGKLVPYKPSSNGLRHASPLQLPLRIEGHRADGKTRYSLIADGQIDPQALCLLELEISSAKSLLPGSKQFVLRWHGGGKAAQESRERTVLLNAGRQHQMVYQHLSEERGWILDDEVSHLAVEADGNAGLQVHSARLVNPFYLYPQLVADWRCMSMLQDGSVRYSNDVQFEFDASKIYTAVAVLVEVSRSDCFFEHYSGTFHDSRPCSKAFKQLVVQRKQGKFRIAANELPSGRCQIRLAALDKTGEMIGFTSDPITLVRF